MGRRPAVILEICSLLIYWACVVFGWHFMHSLGAQLALGGAGLLVLINMNERRADRHGMRLALFIIAAVSALELWHLTPPDPSFAKAAASAGIAVVCGLAVAAVSADVASLLLGIPILALGTVAITALFTSPGEGVSLMDWFGISLTLCALRLFGDRGHVYGYARILPLAGLATLALWLDERSQVLLLALAVGVAAALAASVAINRDGMEEGSRAFPTSSALGRYGAMGLALMLVIVAVAAGTAFVISGNQALIRETVAELRQKMSGEEEKTAQKQTATAAASPASGEWLQRSSGGDTHAGGGWESENADEPVYAANSVGTSGRGESLTDTPAMAMSPISEASKLNASGGDKAARKRPQSPSGSPGGPRLRKAKPGEKADITLSSGRERREPEAEPLDKVYNLSDFDTGGDLAMDFTEPRVEVKPAPTPRPAPAVTEASVSTDVPPSAEAKRSSEGGQENIIEKIIESLPKELANSIESPTASVPPPSMGERAPVQLAAIRNNLPIPSNSSWPMDPVLLATVRVMGHAPRPEALYLRMMPYPHLQGGAFRFDEDRSDIQIRRSIKTLKLRKPRRSLAGASWEVSMYTGSIMALPLPRDFAAIQFDQPTNLFVDRSHSSVIHKGNSSIVYKILDPEPIEEGAVLRSAKKVPRAEMIELDLPQADIFFLASLLDEAGVQSSHSSNVHLIKRYLAANHDYSLTVDVDAGEGQILVRWLRDKEPGFCSHFASSFVLLARAAGIPARLVTGYMTTRFDEHNNRYIIQGSNAHAWAEYMDERDRWVTIDPTPPAPLDVAELFAAAAQADVGELVLNEVVPDPFLAVDEVPPEDERIFPQPPEPVPVPEPSLADVASEEAPVEPLEAHEVPVEAEELLVETEGDEAPTANLGDESKSIVAEETPWDRSMVVDDLAAPGSLAVDAKTDNGAGDAVRMMASNATPPAPGDIGRDIAATEREVRHEAPSATGIPSGSMKSSEARITDVPPSVPAAPVQWGTHLLRLLGAIAVGITIAFAGGIVRRKPAYREVVQRRQLDHILCRFEGSLPPEVLRSDMGLLGSYERLLSIRYGRRLLDESELRSISNLLDATLRQRRQNER